jgi:hypothetical protein
MASLAEDTRQVREEFDGLSKPTQVFVATLDCITYEDTLYCADEAGG